MDRKRTTLTPLYKWGKLQGYWDRFWARTSAPWLEIHLFIYSSIHPAIYPPSHVSTHLSTHPLIHPSIHPPCHLPIHPSTKPSTHPLIHPFTYPLAPHLSAYMQSKQSRPGLLWGCRTERPCWLTAWGVGYAGASLTFLFCMLIVLLFPVRKYWRKKSMNWTDYSKQRTVERYHLRYF